MKYTISIQHYTLSFSASGLICLNWLWLKNKYSLSRTPLYFYLTDINNSKVQINHIEHVNHLWIGSLLPPQRFPTLHPKINPLQVVAIEYFDSRLNSLITALVMFDIFLKSGTSTLFIVALIIAFLCSLSTFVGFCRYIWKIPIH